jgi:hypothetical protein
MEINKLVEAITKEFVESDTKMIKQVAPIIEKKKGGQALCVVASIFNHILSESIDHGFWNTTSIPDIQEIIQDLEQLIEATFNHRLQSRIDEISSQN